MNILITGGAGFIGSQLGFYLQDLGYKVTLVDNLRLGYKDNLYQKGIKFSNFKDVDVCSPEIENLIDGQDVVFHFAGISSLPDCNSNSYEAYKVNVAGTANILEYARKHGIKRIIFSSTSAVYENNTKFPLRESDKIDPTLIYSLSKKHSEDLCKSYEIMYGMDICILRFFNVYGPHMDYLRPNPPFVSYIIKSLLDGKAPVLHSSGKQKRDMIYVDDVLELCKVVIDHPRAKGNVFNVGSGCAVSVSNIFNLVAKELKSNVKPKYQRSNHLWDNYPSLYKGKFPLKPKIVEKEVDKFTLADTNKSKDILKWKTKISIEEGIRKTVEFAKQDYKKRKKK